MADETFGISIIEAQASGLPVVGIAEGAMVDRVPDSLGRTGPIGDGAAMARNIAELWAGDHRAMGLRARAHAEQFSWRQSMERLFGDIYVRALARATGGQPQAQAAPVAAPQQRVEAAKALADA